MPKTILVNDDGWIMGSEVSPLTPEYFREQMVGTYRDTPIQALLWSIGGHETYHIETEVGDVFGVGDDRARNPRQENTYQNIQRLIRDHGGPLTAMARVCRDEGIPLFPSVRMNNHYETDPASPSHSRMRLAHPEWLIGHGEELTPGSIEWGIRTGLNFAVPEVRAHFVAFVTELFERFDIDGVEMDFQRHPGFFKLDEAFSSRHLITDMMTEIRRNLAALNQTRGRSMELAVRVSETLDANNRLGLDVERLIKDGLVDIVMVGGGFMPFDMNFEEFVDAASETECRIHGCIESMRPTAQDDAIRGAAQRIWDAGADGLYLFNYFGRTADWKHQMLNQIGSPETLKGLDKRYEIDHLDRVMSASQIGGAFRNGLPPMQLPLTLQPTEAGVGATFDLYLGDDIEKETESGSLKGCTLRFRLERFGDGDCLAVQVNGQPVSWESAKVSTEDWSVTTHTDAKPGEMRTGWRRYQWYYQDIAEPATVVEFQLDSPPLIHRHNKLQIALVRDDPTNNQPVILRDVELGVRFKR
jgi:hypothetical protein